MQKRKTIVAIFAHPDDEAFGPGGTIATLARTHDVYILCATRGDAGDNHTSYIQEKIFRIRARELQNSAQVLGVKQVFFLGFRDGLLSNKIYHKIADKIKKKLEILKPELVLTFEPRGVSGHIDHAAISLITTYVFYQLQFIKELLYWCISTKHRALIKDYFIYFPPGYSRSQIDKVVDVSSVWNKKIQAIMCHKSQQKDIETIVLPMLEKLPKEEYFLRIKK